ncbi:MAG: hypothetical protein ACXVPQ_04955 [Bacteroidia bacterium]
MKKLLLSFAMVGLFSTAVLAQNGNKTASQNQSQKTTDQKADEQTKKATEKLSLTADQQAKFRAFAVEKINTVTPLREQAKATTDKSQKQAIHAQVKAAREKFVNSVNGILTPDQQTKWSAMKEKMEEHEEANHN